MEELIQRFADIFQGNDRDYGEHIYTDKVDERGKRKGRSSTKHGGVNLDLYTDHINGVKGLGIVPITRDGTVYFSVIDIDEYQKDLKVFQKIIYKNRLPLFPFTSKSGGLHLYVFWEKPEPVKDVIPFLQECLAVLGLPHDTEIFPKQVALNGKESGNWINIPYYKQGEYQYLINARGLKVNLADALHQIESGKTSLVKFKRVMETLPVNDGPPCMQALLLRGEFDNRNDFFLSFGVYAKAKHGDGVYKGAVTEANNSLIRPLTDTELEDTIFKSLDKQTYAYKCKGPPIMDYCNPSLCKTREFGIAGASIPGFDFGQLTQKITEGVPYYEWVVNGKNMRFNSEMEIIKQDKFRALAVRYIHILPPRLKDAKWTSIVNLALETVAVKEVEADVHSEGAEIREGIETFLTETAHDSTIEAVTRDNIFRDTERGVFVARATKLKKYLENVEGIKGLNQEKLEHHISSLKGTAIRRRIDGRQLRVLEIPFESIGFVHKAKEKQEEAIPTADFSDYQKDSAEAWD